MWIFFNGQFLNVSRFFLTQTLITYLYEKQSLENKDVYGSKIVLFFKGIYTYRKVSIAYNDIPSSTNVIVIVITRWYSYEVRNAVRDMFKNGINGRKLEYKLVFLFNFNPEVETEQSVMIHYENLENKDMIIPNVEDNYHTGTNS